MRAQQLLALRLGAADENLLFLHNGYVCEPMLEGIVSTLRRRLDDGGVDPRTARNIFAIFVEQIQNIIRYSSDMTANAGDGGSELRDGIIAVGKENGDYFVACANSVPKSQVTRLSERLNTVREADRDDLKTMYKNKLRGPTEATSKGAGVGLIDMARRSERPIQFEFLDLDDERAFYFLKVFARDAMGDR